MKRKLVILLALVGLLSALVLSRAGAATQSTSPVTSFDGKTVFGSSTLTIWWMVFNHPEACISGTTPDSPRCGMADMQNPAADLSVLYAAGHVIDGSGVADFGGRLAVDDSDGAIMGTGLHDPAGADVTLVVHDHGAADPGQVDEQIHTFDACNPTCNDLQMSVHQAG